MIQPRRSIRDLFLLTIGSTVLLILLLFYSIIYIVIRHSFIKTAEETSSIIIQSSVDRMDGFFNELERLAINLSQSSFVYQKDYAQMAEVFFSLSKVRSDYVSSIYFGSTDGVFLQRGWSSETFTTNQGWAYVKLPWNPGYPGQLPSDYDPRKRPWYLAAVEKKDIVVTSPYPFVTKDNSVTNSGITIAIPVYQPGGKLAGVIGIDCSLAMLGNWVENLHLPQEGKAILMHQSGTVLYWPYSTFSAQEILDPLMSGKRSILSNHSDLLRFKLKGKNMLLTYHKNQTNGLIMLAIFDIQNLMRPGFRAMLLTLAVTVFMLLILLLILKIQVSQLTSPLVSLRNIMEDFKNNNRKIKATVPLHFEDNEVGHLAHTFNEMSDSISGFEDNILHQLYFDRLTGLPNRRRLLEDIKNAIQPVFFLINIDAFKEINDFYGPEIGDYVINETSKRLQVIIDPHSKLYKFPSDEFAILMDTSITAAEIHEKVLYYCSEINRHPITYQDYEIYVQVTTGAAYGNDQDEAIDLISRADMALKKAKRAGQHFLLYQDTMEIRREFERNLTMASKLRQAVHEDRIIPFFQPIMNNSTGRIEKYECLARMLDENGNIVPPMEFLDVAKKTRLYLTITRIMLEKSFNRFKDTDFEFSINLSLDDVLSNINREFILETLWKNPEVSPRVVFEFVESDNIENYEDIRKFILELRNYKARIAIDDFGTGYSNFEHILELRPDYIKLDASLIKNIDQDENSRVIVQTISNLARRLSLFTIAEYVHNQEVLDTEKGLNVDFSQGYFIGLPLQDLVK